MTSVSKTCQRSLFALVVGAVLLAPQAAFAGVLNICPTGDCHAPADNDIEDLDHRNFYVWRVTGVNLGTEEVTGASITFKRMYNWDDNANKLFLQLLDTAISGGGSSGSADRNSSSLGGDAGYNSYVRKFADETATSGPLSNVFNNTKSSSGAGSAAHECDADNSLNLAQCDSKQDTEQTQENNLVAPGTAELFLTKASFPGEGDAPGSLPPGWTVTSLGGGYYDYTYTFTEAQEDVLQSYIKSGSTTGEFAIGLDPDCHFYNDGIMLTLTSGPAIPEPASLLMIGAGIALAGYRRRLVAARR